MLYPLSYEASACHGAGFAKRTTRLYHGFPKPSRLSLWFRAWAGTARRREEPDGSARRPIKPVIESGSANVAHRRSAASR